MMNIDGVINGYSKTNPLGMDLREYWSQLLAHQSSVSSSSENNTATATGSGAFGSGSGIENVYCPYVYNMHKILQQLQQYTRIAGMYNIVGNDIVDGIFYLYKIAFVLGNHLNVKIAFRHLRQYR